MATEISYPIDETLSDVKENRCPIIHAMNILGSKWKLPILWYLHEKENTRFNELKRRIPNITQFMLTKSLRELESDGLVNRRIFKTDPPQIVEYSLTPLALELLPALNELYSWGNKHLNGQQILRFTVVKSKMKF